MDIICFSRAVVLIRRKVYNLRVYEVHVIHDCFILIILKKKNLQNKFEINSFNLSTADI